MNQLKRTPLYEYHEKLGARFVPFAGYEMPVQYSGVVPEHHAVRQTAGLFDVSHMGEVFVEGEQACEALDSLTCNNVSKLTDGRAHYNAIINEKGGVVDDVIIYKFSDTKYLVCVNASNADKDFAWFQNHNKTSATFTNKSDYYGQVALQGPKAMQIIAAFLDDDSVMELKYFSFEEREIFGASSIIARTGYTGEDGVELFVPREAVGDVWQGLLEVGNEHGILPCGLGARDSLRLEACYPLHGHELGDDISAIESGLGWIVKLKKPTEFIGKDILSSHKKDGAPRKLVGLFVEDKGIVREGDKLFDENGEEIGRVTSGTKTPTIGKALGLALVKSGSVSEGGKLIAEVRGRRLSCVEAPIPFYKRG